jgi:hypothetical protein
VKVVPEFVVESDGILFGIKLYEGVTTDNKERNRGRENKE